MKNCILLVLLSIVSHVYSQTDSIPLDEVIINDLSIPQKQKHATESIAIIPKHQIQSGNTLELHPILNKVAGVFMQNGTLNTNRITIRGIGARNLFGTANIRAYFGDIPLTDGNGESAIEDLELAALSTIEIHKGPSASNYGVGLGGTILFKPKPFEEDKTQGSLSTSFGSYGLKRILANIQTGSKKAGLQLLYSNNQSDGYRSNNTYNRNSIMLSSFLEISKKDKLELLGNFINLRAGIPSSLSADDFDKNPRNAAFTWGQSQAFEDTKYGLLGITWNHEFHPKVKQITSVFGSIKNNYEPRPFNILQENTNGFGFRTRTLGNPEHPNKKLQWSIGGEFFFDTYQGQTYQNLYRDFPIGTGSVQGNQLSNLDENRSYYTIFAETNYTLHPKVRFNLGLHLNQTFFTVRDRFLTDGNDSSGNFDFNPILSPKIGVNYAMHPNINCFGNIAHGFSTPTTSETLLPEGIFNPKIKPERGWNYEIGARYSLFKNKVFGSLSLYSLQVRDLLVSRRTIEDNFFAINAGKTIHNGIEAEINYQIKTSAFSKLNLFINTAINDYSFREFIDLNNNFSGNKLTGVPKSVTNLGVNLIAKKGIYGNLNWQYVGAIPVNDANTVFSDTYQLLNAKIGYRNEIGTHFWYNVFVGANNILDTRFASQIQVNARGFGDNMPRYFYPGNPFAIFTGVNINYTL